MSGQLIIILYRHDSKAFKLCHMLSTLCFTHSQAKLCLFIVIMGSSGDICNGNQIQIIGFKCNGIQNHVIAAQFSCNKKECKIVRQGRPTDYQAGVKKGADMVVGKRRQLL